VAAQGDHASAATGALEGTGGMSSKLNLSLACGDYEITRPLIDGRVKPDGIELIVITPESRERH
jgi:hypothetical protein